MEKLGDSWDELEIGEEGEVPTIRPNKVRMGKKRRQMFYCYNCHRNFKANVGTENWIVCDEGFMEMIEDNPGTDTDSDEEAKSRQGTSRMLNLHHQTDDDSVDSVDLFRSLFRRPPGGWQIQRGRTPQNGVMIMRNYGNNRQRDSIFAAGNNNFGRPDMMFSDFDRIFEMLLQRVGQNGNAQTPASKNAIKKLKSVKIRKEDYEEDETTGEMVPPSWTICTDEMIDKSDNSNNKNPFNKIKKLPCDHMFHKKCIVKWLKIHNACPICRKDID